ncbi:MAG: flagellin [Syntrophothermus sp.]
MSFSINSNLGALQAYSALDKVSNSASKAQLKLATQKRINSVSDDTSGYRVGKELEGKIASMKSAQNNISSAKNVLSTAESALSSVNDLLIQIKSKIADSSDTSKNLTSLSDDINALGDEIVSIFANTTFNTTSLLSGSVPTGSNFVFKTGESETTTVNFGTLNTLDLGSISGGGATSTNITTLSVDTITTAVQDALGKIGNYNQRLSIKEDFLTSAISNASASVSRLMDTDMAMEQLNSTKGQIGGNVSTSMLGQLNSAPNSLLSLFR